MNLQYFRQILISGFVSALAALPLSIGFALIAGVPPSVMVAASIYAGLFSAVFGGRYGVGGPNAAVAIMTGAALIPFAPPESDLYIGYVLTLCFLVGMYQLLFSLVLRKVNLLDYVSTTVVDGLIYGIGVMFVLSSLWMALGLAQPGGVQWTVFSALMSVDRLLDGSASSSAAWIAAATIAAGVAALYWRPIKRYSVLAGIAGGSLAALWIGGDLERVGWIAPDLFAVSLPDFRQVSWPVLFNLAGGPALAIALVATLQSLTAAKTIRDLDEPFRPVRETANQGMQNLFMAFFHGAPVAISYNKSTLKQALGGRWDSHLLTAGATILLAYGFTDAIAWLPMSVMGGALILVGFGMMAPAKYRKHASHGRVRKLLFIVPAALAVLVDTQTAVFAGVALSLLAHISSLSRLDIQVSRAGGMITLALSGVLFYVSSTRLEAAVREKLQEADDAGLHESEAVTLDLTAVHLMAMDALTLDWISRLEVPVTLKVRADQRDKAEDILKKEGLTEHVTVQTEALVTKLARQSGP
jgi:sulfate permease, SulP family